MVIGYWLNGELELKNQYSPQRHRGHREKAKIVHFDPNTI